jgi:hypothetical protein
MLLILPVFLGIVFAIMEMGNIAFWIIVLNHATYECARIGAMKAWSPNTGLGGSPNDMTALMQGEFSTMIKSPSAKIISTSEATLTDPQSGNQNYDLFVQGSMDVQMLFPISSVLMSSPIVCPQGPGGGKCTMTVNMRMPVEQPIPR